jgi:chaperonin GroEL (HSP60 family)
MTYAVVPTLTTSPGLLLLLQGSVTDMREEKVVQPLLVTSSALTLATECVRMILKVRASFVYF